MTKRWVAFSREYEMSKGEQLGQNGNRYIETSSACLQQSPKQSFSRPSPLACTEALSLVQSKEQNTDRSFCSIFADQGGPIRSNCDGSGSGGCLYSSDPQSDSSCVRRQRGGKWGLCSASCPQRALCSDWLCCSFAWCPKVIQNYRTDNALRPPTNIELYSICHFIRWIFGGRRKKDKI